jgi:hypothetical protein
MLGWPHGRTQERCHPARSPPQDAREWSDWTCPGARGFVGTFVVSLTDHVQNGFYHPAEWIPVVASAGAIGCSIEPFIVDVPKAYLRRSV